MPRTILVVAKNNKVEALRVAVGLALLSNVVEVIVLGQLDDSPAILEQKEVLEFADVNCEILQDAVAQTATLARKLAGANVVYVI